MDRRGFLRRALAAAAAVALPTPALAGSGVCNQCGMTNGMHRSWCTRAALDVDVEEPWTVPTPGKFYEIAPGTPVLALMTYGLRIDERGRLVVELVNHSDAPATVRLTALDRVGKTPELRSVWAERRDGRELPVRRADVDEASRVAYELGVQQARLADTRGAARWLPFSGADR